jgi:hypothetical protein
MQHLAALNRLIAQPGGADRHSAALLDEARAFHAHFHSPAQAPFPSQQADELRPLLAALAASPPMAADLEVVLMLHSLTHSHTPHTHCLAHYSTSSLRH